MGVWSKNRLRRGRKKVEKTVLQIKEEKKGLHKGKIISKCLKYDF